MKTNHFKQALSTTFFTLMAATMSAQAQEDQVVASFERELNLALLGSPVKVLNEQDQVSASFSRNLNHEAATPTPATRAQIDQDVLYRMISNRLQSETVSIDSSEILVARAD